MFRIRDVGAPAAGVDNRCQPGDAQIQSYLLWRSRKGYGVHFDHEARVMVTVGLADDRHTRRLAWQRARPTNFHLAHLRHIQSSVGLDAETIPSEAKRLSGIFLRLHTRSADLGAPAFAGT